MTLNEIVQATVWLFLLGSIVYAHLSYCKLRKVIFNDLKHLLKTEKEQRKHARV